MNSSISSHSGPAVTSTIAKTAANSAAKTASAARPAAPAAPHERADHRVEPERDHGGDEDRQQRPERHDGERDEEAERASTDSVRAGMTISTRCGGRSIAWTLTGAAVVSFTRGG